MKNRKNLLLFILAAFLAGNLVIQSCRKDYSPTQSTDDFSSIASDRTDSTNYYKTMVAKCVARGLTDTNFKNFFKRISARWEGNQNGFSLWHYRDSIVSVSQYTSLTLAGFLAYQASQLGYSYNMAFFRGHLVRYIPNLSIGIAIYDTTRVQNYVFTSTLKVADVASTYYSDTTYGGYATLYSQTQTTSYDDLDNANYDFVYVLQNPYYELFKTSNHKSLDGDKTIFELHALPDDEDFEEDFEDDLSGTTYKYRFPGVESISGTNCILVDKFQVVAHYTFENGVPTGDPATDPPGDPDDESGDRGTQPCEEDSDCDRDGLDDYERVRFVQMVHGHDVKSKMGCGIFHNFCQFQITEYFYVPVAGNTAAGPGQKTKTASLWRKALKNGDWVWWNDIDNAYTIWKYCEGEHGNQMFYGVIGRHTQGGTESTTTFSLGITGITFKLLGAEASLGLTNGFSWSKKKTNKDYDFGQTETVYYCDPCHINLEQGQTYSTGLVRLRIREHY